MSKINASKFCRVFSISDYRFLYVYILGKITLSSLKIWENDTHPQTRKEKTLHSLEV